MRIAARAGFAARGVVYVLIGVLAVRIAFGDPGAEADRRGALEQVARQPFGEFLLWVIGLAFAGLALWRLTEAVYGPTTGSGGGEGKRTVKRLAALGRAVFYGVVAAGVFGLVLGSGGPRSSDHQSKGLSARAMEWPGGRWLVGAVGIGFVAAGCWIAARAAMRKFMKKMETGRMSAKEERAVEVLGAAGGVARGVVFATAGVFAVVAAVQFDPDKAKGVDDTLRSFTQTPAGPWLLVVVAVGLVLFGVFSFACARRRKV
ncbi:DUF1206 domain-containing protein [Streptomyces sp. NPDC001380]|uniref:DUF1206 domain-containing protein n=1 Tax=Streptomyces sp. NPDC001380 TaxID=3364566 RepID=UPI0036C50BD6